MKLAIRGGTPVRQAFPEPRPRLSAAEAAALASALSAAGDWSRAGDDWPLPHLDRLEAEWGLLHQAADAVALSSGTAALTLVMQALDLPPGDEVLVPAYGCPAVNVAVLAAGLTPIHVEVDPATYCIAPAAAASAVTARVGAIVAVHFAGQPARLDSLARVAGRSGIALVEDACLAPGAAYSDVPVGTWGRAAVFSLGVRKPLSAGEGGLVTTNEPALAAALRRARSLGADPETGEIVRPTGNYRMTELQAAAVLPQLACLEADRRRREAAAATLADALRDTTLLRPLEVAPRVSCHAWAQFWLRYDEEAAGVPRDRFAEAVQAEGIPLFAGWTCPNYCLPLYTPDSAREWLPGRGSDRGPELYERAHCPHAESAAFREALLLDFPILDAGAPVVADAAEALRKVIHGLDQLRSRG